MPALFLLAIIAWSVIPYKAWSRAVLGSEGFNLGDIFLILVLGGVLLQLPHWRKRSTLWPWVVVIWGLLAVCAFKGLLQGENVREIGRVLRGGAFWIIIPLMLLTITTREGLRRWFTGMTLIVIVAGGTLVAFSFFPGLIPPGEEVGVFRGESVGGFERVFTLGMWAVFGGSIMAMSAVFFRRGGRLAAATLLLTLLVCLSFTFARTFFLGILLALFIFLPFGQRATLGVATLGGASAGLIGFAVGLPGFLVRLGRAVSERAMLVLTETPEYAFQTLFWRLSEYAFFSENMTSAADRWFGVLGRTYSLPEGYTASMPHIAYLGIYYGFGYLGLLVYAVFLIGVTARMVANALRTRGTDLMWVTAGACATWIVLLAAGISAPIFHYAWGVAALAFTAGLSESVVALLRNSHEPPFDQHHHPLPQRGAIHPRHG
jgi:hypothetical protein